MNPIFCDETYECPFSFEKGSTKPSTSSSSQTQSNNQKQPSVEQRPEYKRTKSDLVILEQKPVTKVPTVATDQELMDFLESRCNDQKGFKNKYLTPRKARALRRKLYLDLYSEVAQKMFI